ncbi:hypothetical protein V6N11_071448 [Hibiscus sabdariffa]|uniref:Uncharacterized protein n=1 Tax=Hibiscus sabdariffa TaxID=183260 RepID=A0ABR2U0D2_9ROSI
MYNAARIASSSVENNHGMSIGIEKIARTSSFSDNKMPPQPHRLLIFTVATENFNGSLKDRDFSSSKIVTLEGLTHHPSRLPIGLPCADFSRIRALILV